MGIEIHCHRGCSVKEICKTNIELNIGKIFRNTDIGVPGCLLEKLIVNLKKL